jgi:hypothetical protein
VTPIGQQNPPEPLKLFGLHEKTGKIPIFDFSIKKNGFVRCTFCDLVRARGGSVSIWFSNSPMEI